MAENDKAVSGNAEIGKAKSGKAESGKAERGNVECGKAKRGKAERGKAKSNETSEYLMNDSLASIKRTLEERMKNEKASRYFALCSSIKRFAVYFK